jgi:hypothetical protein
MSLLRIIGVLLIVGLVAWLATAVLPLGRHPAPEVLGLGSAFEGNLQLPGG